MAITDWAVEEWPREKLLLRGAQAVSDAELLAIFLRTGVAGQTAVDLARFLLAQFGGLRGLLQASSKTFCSARGLGPAKYAQLQAVLEMGRRHLREHLLDRAEMTSSAAIRDYVDLELRGENREVFSVLFLDSQHRFLGFERLFLGTINATSVYFREIIDRCFHHNAAACVVAHNHPSGLTAPSAEDIRLTKDLRNVLGSLDIRLLDHIIVGGSGTLSMSEQGLF